MEATLLQIDHHLQDGVWEETIQEIITNIKAIIIKIMVHHHLQIMIGENKEV